MIQSADIKDKKKAIQKCSAFFYTHYNLRPGENTEFFSEKHLLVFLMKIINNFE
jgi:hypothetical protein